MVALKISCTQCQQNAECPYRTQFYVNYCGAEQKKMTQGIKTAMSECRARRSRLFKRAFGRTIVVSPMLHTTAVAAAVPT